MGHRLLRRGDAARAASGAGGRQPGALAWPRARDRKRWERVAGGTGTALHAGGHAGRGRGAGRAGPHVAAAGRRKQDGGAHARDEDRGQLGLRQQRALHRRQHHLRPARRAAAARALSASPFIPCSLCLSQKALCPSRVTRARLLALKAHEPLSRRLRRGGRTAGNRRRRNQPDAAYSERACCRCLHAGHPTLVWVISTAAAARRSRAAHRSCEQGGRALRYRSSRVPKHSPTLQRSPPQRAGAGQRTRLGVPSRRTLRCRSSRAPNRSPTMQHNQPQCGAPGGAPLGRAEQADIAVQVVQQPVGRLAQRGGHRVGAQRGDRRGAARRGAAGPRRRRRHREQRQQAALRVVQERHIDAHRILRAAPARLCWGRGDRHSQGPYLGHNCLSNTECPALLAGRTSSGTKCTPRSCWERRGAGSSHAARSPRSRSARGTPADPPRR